VPGRWRNLLASAVDGKNRVPRAISARGAAIRLVRPPRAA
jgi:hypothetical protein